MYTFGVTTGKRNFNSIVQKLGPISLGLKVNQPYAAQTNFRAVLPQKYRITGKFPKGILVRKNPRVASA